MTAPTGRSDRLLALGGGVALGLGVVVWLTGEMAALLSHGRWPAVSPAAVLSVLAALPSSLGNPAHAWPPSIRNQLPVALGWYLLSASLSVAAVVGAAVPAVRLARVAGAWLEGGAGPPWTGLGGARPSWTGPGGAARSGAHRRAPGSGSGLRLPALGSASGGWRIEQPPGHRSVGGAHWARRPELGPLPVRHPGQGRLVLGRVGRGLVATESRQSVLVLGPTQSGKTTALAIPALLEWDGPVVATSVKDDLVAHTRAYRSQLGRIWVFDPTGTEAGGGRSRWSPLGEAGTWSGAQRVAHALVEATPSRSGLSDGAFWFAASAKLLAPLLLGAARGGLPISEVVRWTNLQETEEVRLLLELAGEDDAVRALVAGTARDERIRSSIYTTLETVLAPYEDPVVAASSEAPDIDPVALLQARNTLYLCGPAHEQARVQGVFSALIGAVVHAAIARYERHGPLDPPLLVVLDEAANIAPLQDLDRLASTGAGMGIQLVTVCQDLAQLATRYGPDRARSIANNHRAKVALSGIADVGTLDTLSGLVGEQAIREQTTTADLREGRRSTSSSIAYRRLAPPDELRRIPPGRGVLIYGHLPPARLELRPWYRDAELRRRVAAPLRAGGPSPGSA